MDLVDNPEYLELRRRAEKILAENPSVPLAQISEADLLKIMHEIAVYRIELDLQNEVFERNGISKSKRI